MKHTIEISGEDINSIVVEELQDAFKWNLDNDNENELLNAIEVLLSYYMTPSEYSAWFVSRGRDQSLEHERMRLAHKALDEMVAENQRLGLYDD